MCGRFALGIPVSYWSSYNATLVFNLISNQHSQIAELHGYNVQVGEWVDQEHFHPR